MRKHSLIFSVLYFVSLCINGFAHPSPFQVTNGCNACPSHEKIYLDPEALYQDASGSVFCVDEDNEVALKIQHLFNDADGLFTTENALWSAEYASVMKSDSYKLPDIDFWQCPCCNRWFRKGSPCRTSGCPMNPGTR